MSGWGEEESECTYYVIYPGGDLSKLCVLRLYYSDHHKLDQYVVASRNSFAKGPEATAYAVELAASKELTFIHDALIDPDAQKESLYLD
ncbi:hypothetical protein YA0089_27290 [Pseudomonas viridiflava]|uniref:hypothetical protein n=1 Tax=Pseudomonas viridiflava TaxID=33069 RepID=UPI0018E648A9|nr:hypothetical protein [Pseudomonas viridiflava]MBI6727324.1 hypothetical protein [Pseudomonas viridiflava]